MSDYELRGYLVGRTDFSEPVMPQVCYQSTGRNVCDDVRLEMLLPLPPPKNNLFRAGRYGGYPTGAYLEWLELCAPYLRDALGDREPSEGRWWRVICTVALGPRDMDVQNYETAILDFLSGRDVEREENGRAKRTKNGTIDSKIIRIPGWWKDDRWVARIDMRLEAVRCPFGAVIVQVSEYDAPGDYKAERQAREKAEKQAARDAAKAARQAEKAAKKGGK